MEAVKCPGLVGRGHKCVPSGPECAQAHWVQSRPWVSLYAGERVWEEGARFSPEWRQGQQGTAEIPSRCEGQQALT